MRTGISPVPRILCISLNSSIGVRTFKHALPACESARESRTCSYSCEHACGPVLINLHFPQLLSTRTSISPVPRMLYIPLNSSICMGTFTCALPTCESARESRTCSYSCEHACGLVLINLHFPPTSQHAHKFITCS